MRQVFSSPRLENVEGVARLLNEHGIATRIRNGRSYKGGYRRGFSYRAPPASAEQATVWVIRSDDQPKARQLLREAGLIDSTRPEARGSFAPSQYVPATGQREAGPRLFSPGRLRIALLFGIGLVIAMGLWWRYQAPRHDAPAPAAANTRPAPPAMAAARALDQVYRAEVPTALAELMFARIADSADIQRACLKRDGLEVSGIAHPASADCASAEARIEVRDYRTDGSGSGTVEVEWRSGKAGAKRRHEVRREGRAWEVLRELP
ncbi:hypothetical protein [Solilutibacter pythonis]|uniref:hypothetical protein n=1 Tax=Solilutibacter pythonis TaxID=2483112 RepID=UPI001B8734D8|nr:hypothetical protein [Lysobacter pythonis]